MTQKLPFQGLFIAKNPEMIANKFSGEEILCQPDAVAVYDTIQGAEMLGDYKIVRTGLDWFREKYPKEYMVLLD